MTQIVQVHTIEDVHNLWNLPQPQHPLITVIREWPAIDFDANQLTFTSDLYYINLKGDLSGSFQYGRNSYDYQQGTLIFIGPGQTATFSRTKDPVKESGWVLMFHPDLIRKSELGKTIKNYSFFRYEVTEALHLSERERNYINVVAENLESEISQNIDKHSQELIVNHLETILKYSSRFYDRQFYTRTNLNKDLVGRFEDYLRDYFSNKAIDSGLPTIGACGKALNMSGQYLSDLLKLETGKSAKYHIHDFVIDRAKTTLLNSDKPISEIAYDLGFEYPQHFSRLFKVKTGLSPTEYRNINE